MLRPLIVVCLACSVLVLSVGCQQAAPDLGPPEGWVAAAEDVQPQAWWRPGTDTAQAFRALETLEAMGITDAGITYVGSASAARQSGEMREEFRRGVKRELLPFFRNQPEVVDSLFNEVVAPRLAETSIEGAVSEAVESAKRTSYERLRRNFREARVTTQLGEDVPVIYPDSLREQGVGGFIRLQVYLDDTGSPQAIELIEGVHPVLDALAFQATTQLEWQPAYVSNGRKWTPVPSWVWYRIWYSAPETAS